MLPLLRPNMPSLSRLLRRPLAHRLPAALLILLAGAAVTPLTGCQTPEEVVERERGLLQPQSFRATWKINVDTAAHGEVDRMFLRDDLLFIYTTQNVVYVASADSGTVRFVATDVVGPRDQLWPPVLVAALNRLGSNITRFIAFPANTEYILYTDQGDLLQETGIPSAFTSPTTAFEGLTYAGLADRHGGRIARMDPTLQVGPVLTPRLLQGPIISRPAVFQSTIFVGDETGTVYAITPDGAQAWNRNFTTGGPIRANLTVDEYGVYVPSTDTTFYVLDRISGRLKWRYFASVPLYKSAVPGEESIYLPVQGEGVVSLSKTEGRTVSREPSWVAAEAIDVLSQDQENVYLLHGDGYIAAYDKAQGQEKFRSDRNDFAVFARNRDASRIFAARRDGEVVAVDPVLTRGQVGELAGAAQRSVPMASAR